MSVKESDRERLFYLNDAEQKAVALFKEIEETLIRPGVSDKELSEEIYALGAKKYGIRTHWHKRVVRSGPNTLRPFADNPPDRVIQPDDMLVVDLGPVFEAWEADFGRTYVLGDDPNKKRMRDDLEAVWKIVQSRFIKNTFMSGEELYKIAVEETEKRGWKWGAPLAGHLIGDFPHERIPNDKINLYITPGNSEPMNTLGPDGRRRHWILEIYLREPGREYGAFFEQLLTCDEWYLNTKAAQSTRGKGKDLSIIKILSALGLGVALLLTLLRYMST